MENGNVVNPVAKGNTKHDIEGKKGTQHSSNCFGSDLGQKKCAGDSTDTRSETLHGPPANDLVDVTSSHELNNGTCSTVLRYQHDNILRFTIQLNNLTR